MTRFAPATRSRLRHPVAQPPHPIQPLTPDRGRPPATVSTMLFRVDVEQAPDVQLVRLHGELDAAGVDILAEVLACERHIAAGRGAQLRLDLAEVTFMDSEALWTVLQAKQASESASQEFSLDDQGDAALKALDAPEAAGLLGIFEAIPA